MEILFKIINISLSLYWVLWLYLGFSINKITSSWNDKNKISSSDFQSLFSFKFWMKLYRNKIFFLKFQIESYLLDFEEDQYTQSCPLHK